MSETPTPTPQPPPPEQHEPEQPDTGERDALGRAVEDGRDYLGRDVSAPDTES